MLNIEKYNELVRELDFYEINGNVVLRNALCDPENIVRIEKLLKESKKNMKINVGKIINKNICLECLEHPAVVMCHVDKNISHMVLCVRCFIRIKKCPVCDNTTYPVSHFDMYSHPNPPTTDVEMDHCVKKTFPVVFDEKDRDKIFGQYSDMKGCMRNVGAFVDKLKNEDKIFFVNQLVAYYLQKIIEESERIRIGADIRIMFGEMLYYNNMVIVLLPDIKMKTYLEYMRESIMICGFVRKFISVGCMKDNDVASLTIKHNKFIEIMKKIFFEK